MPDMDFTCEFFSGNRQRLLKVTDAKLIVLSANGLLQRTTDTTYPFRQDSNFWYLTGIEEADYILVLTEDNSFLIAPPRAEHRDMWDGAINKKQLFKTSGISDVLEHHVGWTKLDQLLKKIKKVHTITPAEAYYNSFGFYSNPARMALLTALKKHTSLELVDIRKPLALLRQIKQLPELLVLKKAIDITSKTLLSIQNNLKNYTYEYEIVADITRGFIFRGASGHAYEPIVASGVNAATIHHLNYNSLVMNNALILFDVGAEVSNYSADISRTYAVGNPSKRATKVYEAVMRVRQEAFNLLKPGVLPREYEATIDTLIAVELNRLGLLDDVTDKKKFRKLYPHLTSHFLGLDTHDSADYEQPLKVGMVLTVEPGIYIQSEGIGVRIEDDVLITKDGIEILSDSLPSTLV
jgi:Xaa-Pro aminopeptidase